MKSLTLLLFIAPVLAYSQSIKEVKPAKVFPLTLNAADELKFNTRMEAFNKVVDKISKGTKEEDLTPEEKKIYSETDDTMTNYWDILGGGCSWYCGGGPDEVKASSALKAQGANSYVASNAHDSDYKTAWVEGAAGYGIGEYLSYKFAPENPRITNVIVVNGYVKSEKAYLDNSRVKKLKMYVNDKPYAILNLEDKRSSQYFVFDPIGNGNRANLEALKKLPAWTLKFEIMEVYKGLKYDDVVVSEIYFDGLDVH